MVLRGTINRPTRPVCGCLESFGEVQCYESEAATHPDGGLKKGERERERGRALIQKRVRGEGGRDRERRQGETDPC